MRLEGNGCKGGPRVTVGISFRNAEDTLRDAIKSVFAQTFKDWELILFDDGSTDGSLKIAQAIGDSRVTVRSAARNQGLPCCLNDIAGMARGEYLARMDADDIMHPERIERQVKFLDENPSADVVGTGAYVIDGSGKPTGIRAIVPPATTFPALLRVNLIIHPAVTGRIQWFRDNPYDPSYHRAEDHELWCRTCGHTSFGHIGEPLMFVRNAARGEVRKYRESCRCDRRIYRRYGPAQVGWARTAGLIAGSYAKPVIYGLLTRLSLETRLLGLRNRKISSEQARAASAILASLAEAAGGPVR